MTECIASVVAALSEVSSSVETKAASRGMVVVADGGSSDATRERAREAGAVVVETKPGDARGRGPSLERGARALPECADVLFFLHVDCRVPKCFFRDVATYWRKYQPQIAVCRIKFDQDTPSLRFFAWTASFESVFTTFGDQGILVTRALHQSLNGFPPTALLEDVEYLRRARRIARIHKLPTHLLVSARKFSRRGALLYMAQCVVVLNLYIVGGWSPERLRRLYADPAFLKTPFRFFCALVVIGGAYLSTKALRALLRLLRLIF